MRARAELNETLRTVLTDLGLPWPAKTVIEPPRDPRHGDLALNVAMALSRQTNEPPRRLAERLAAALRGRGTCFAGIDVAGPGFINVTFSASFWQSLIRVAEEQADAYGSSSPPAATSGRRVLVEYVSANPTGPLHIGHGRGAAVGDSLARILRFAGHEVATEYYINDAGRQMRLLGLSIWLRVRELAGLPVDLPEDWYRGEYIRDIAADMLRREPDLAGLTDARGEELCFAHGMETILRGIREDLARFRVEHQIWFSERSLTDEGRVSAVLERLAREGLTFEEENALWFRSADFGDDRNRVLRKSDGSLTYFASDIAYHDDKYRRGFDTLVDVWGTDHHGYVPRLRAAVAALGRAPDTFDVVLIHLVTLLRQGQIVPMSTRAGTFVTLAEVLDEVGTDAARFMFLSRKSDSPLDFDLDLVKQRSMDNPVYYVQYAHARTQSMLRRAPAEGRVLPESSDPEILARLVAPEELALLRSLDRFADVVAHAAAERAPHSVSYYLMELAGQLHGYYARHPVLQAPEAELVLARLALMRAVGQTLRNGLGLLGVQAPESM
jgi:arginyl-tRNA synthetase